jgi:phosphatidate cytidylyltransferase
MTRILTAVVLIPVALYLVLWAPPYLLVAVQVFLTLVALWEFFNLAEVAAGAKLLRLPGYAFGAAIASLSLTESLPRGLVAVTTVFLMLLSALAMWPKRPLGDYLKSVSATLLGVLYVAVPLTLLVWVCLRYDGPFWTLFTLVVIWASDTSGWFFGKTFGKHKSSPRISPNKTWEGTAASFAGAILVGLIFAAVFRDSEGYWRPILLAAALNVAGQLGDLAESAMKRSAGVKDSSNLVPGHGGVLDRIDALLFAAPILWYYWLWKA